MSIRWILPEKKLRNILIMMSAVLFAGCYGPAELEEFDDIDVQTDPVVYGSDDRTHSVDHTDVTLREMSKSVATLTSGNTSESRHVKVDAKSGKVTLTTQPHRGMVNWKTYPLCKGQNFRDERELGFCTGFLIGPRRMATEAHCAGSLPLTQAAKDNFCQRVRVVFDYAKGRKIGYQDVYRCQKVIADGGNTDWLLFELDRDTGRTPLELNQNTGVVAKNVDLAVIGHGNGIRQTIDTGSSVRALSYDGNNELFVHNADTFHAHSGSPIIDMRDYKVVGILNSGEDDWTLDKANNCVNVNDFDDDEGDGERSVYITELEEYMDASEPNDTASQAKLSPVPLRPGFGGAALMFQSTNHRIHTGDEDYFAIPVYSGDKLGVVIEFDDSLGDLDLVLYDQDYGFLDEGVSQSDDETLTLTVGSNVTGVLARVYGFAGATNTYSISIMIVPDEIDTNGDGTPDPARTCYATRGLGWDCPSGQICNPRPPSTWMVTTGQTFDLNHQAGVCEPSWFGNCHQVQYRFGTEHPYMNDYQMITEIAIPDSGVAEWSFTGFQTEPLYDYLELTNYSRMSGIYLPGPISDSPTRDHIGMRERSIIFANFVSSLVVDDWGFEVDSITWCE